MGFIFFCSVEVVQSMELEVFSKNQVEQCDAALQQSMSFQKISFYPVGPGLDITLNDFVMLQSKSIDDTCIWVKITLPKEMWHKIWGYLDQKDKLELALLSHSFEHISQYLQLERCRQTLINDPGLSGNYLHSFYVCASKVCKIRDTTKIEAVKTQCKVLLQESNSTAQEFIDKLNRRYDWCYGQLSKSDYEKVKRIKEIYDDLNAYDMWCVECRDHWCKTKGNCYEFHSSWCVCDRDSSSCCDYIVIFTLLCPLTCPLMCCCGLCPVILQCLCGDCCCYCCVTKDKYEV